MQSFAQTFACGEVDSIPLAQSNEVVRGSLRSIDREASGSDHRALNAMAIDPDRLVVHRTAAAGALAGFGLHWFEVELKLGVGCCFITTGEAHRLRQLDVDWVKQALLNLATKRGWSWLEAALLTRPGLMLHHGDASDLWGRRSRSDAMDAQHGDERAP